MKLALALGGGGAKGIAHIGVLRVLESARIPIDFIAGTSAGAIIGALYAAGKSAAEVQALAERLRLRHWLMRDRSGMGLFSTDGIRRIIDTEIGKGARIEHLERKFAAVAVDLDSRQEVVFTSGLVSDAVCASAAFPGLFAPVCVGDRVLIDGGALNPGPADVARCLGADVVVAVDLGADEPFFTAGNLHQRQAEGWFFRLLLTAEQQKIFRVAARSLGVMTYQLHAQKTRECPPDLIIHPDVQDIGLMDFDLAELCLTSGEKATRNALPYIQTLIAPSARTHVRRAWRQVASRLKRSR